jgi:SUZ domain-containing RNA-binding protein
MGSKKDKTAIIDASVLEDFVPDDWEEQPLEHTEPDERTSTPTSELSFLTNQRIEILRNQNIPKKIDFKAGGEKREHLSMEDRRKRYEEARARIFNKDDKIKEG